MHALALEPGRVEVRGRGFVEERQARRAGRRHDLLRPPQGLADETDPDAANRPDGRRRQERRVRRVVDDVGREILEASAVEAGAVEAAIGRVTAAALQAEQFTRAAIELVVADGGDGEVHRVHRLDRWFVVEEGGDERRGAHQIAGSDDDRTGVPGSGVSEMRGQVFGPSRRRPVDETVRARRWLEVAVEVVDRE